MTFTRALLFASFLSLSVSAQVVSCPYTVSIASYGNGCNTAFGTIPTLSGTFNPTNCSITLTHSSLFSCCNTYVVDRLLLLGFAQASIPVPGYPSCSFLTTNDLILPLTPTTGVASITFNLPLGLSPFVVYAQAGAIYFTTIGFNYDVSLTNGLMVGVQ